MADEVPKAPFTDEQSEALRAQITSVVNSAIASRDKMADKKRAEDREAIKSDFAKILEEKFSSLAPPDREEGGGKKGKNDGSVELQTMKKELAEYKMLAEQSRERAEQERSKSRSLNLRTQAAEELSKFGIAGIHGRMALSVLLQEGRIAFRDDVGQNTGVEDADEIVFHDDGEGWIKLSQGLKGWSKSTDAKIFLPPTGAAGAGTRPAQPAPTVPVKLSEEERKHLLGEFLNKALE